MRFAKSRVRASGLALVILLSLLPALNRPAEAQGQPSSEADQVDAATVRSMLKRIAELEAEVKDLKAAKTGQVVSDNAATKPIEPQDVSPAPSPNITVSNPQILEAQRGIQFRGFGERPDRHC